MSRGLVAQSCHKNNIKMSIPYCLHYFLFVLRWFLVVPVIPVLAVVTLVLVWGWARDGLV